MHFLHWLGCEEAAVERRPALDATLYAWVEGKHHGLLPVLRAHNPLVAELLAPRLRSRAKPALELVSMFFFTGKRRDVVAWRSESLRAALVSLCRRSGDGRRLEADPYGSAMLVARKIIEENRAAAKQREREKRKRRGG